MDAKLDPYTHIYGESTGKCYRHANCTNLNPVTFTTGSHFHGFTCSDANCTGRHSLADRGDGGGGEDHTDHWAGYWRSWFKIGDYLPIGLGLMLGIPLGIAIGLFISGLVGEK